MANLVGQTIGQYEVVEHLGQGGMADVYKAFHPGLAVYRALKVIRMELGAGPDFKERFQREAQAVAGLRHPNIVRMNDFGVHDGLYYMVMEFIEGRDLKIMLTERGPIQPLTEVAEVVTQVASALSHAHEEGIVHRDVKPANIMRATDGQIILTDFGIAKMLTTDEPITQTGVGIGTPAYMSPEQAQGLPGVGPPTDIYSLGVVVYQMLSGRVPYSADTPMAVALKVLNEPLPSLEGDVPDAIRAVVRKATAKDPENRYASANALAEALDEAIASAPASSATVTMPLDDLDADADPPAASDEVDTEPEPAPASPSSSGGWVVAGLLFALLAIGGMYYFRTAWMPLIGITEDAPTVTEQSPLAMEAESDPLPADSSKEALAATPNQEKPAAEEDASASGVSPTEELGASTEEAAPSHQESTPPEASQPTESTARRQTEEAATQRPSTPEQTPQPTASSTDRPAEPHDDQAQPRASTPPPSVSPSEAEEERGFHVQDVISIPGQTAEYTFEGQQGQRIFFDFLSSTADADFVLRAPDGTDVFEAFMQDAGPVTLDQAGEYTVAVEPWGQATPSFAFTIVDRIAKPLPSTAIPFNEPVQGTISVPGDSATFAVEIEANQQVYFDFESSTADTDFILRAPDGTQVFHAFMQDAGPFTLEQAGTYTLTVDAWDQAAPSFEFVLRAQ